MCPVDEEQFRLEDYKLKLEQLNGQAERMWTRFNYFVTIEAALVGLFAVANSHQFKERAPWAALAEFLISLVWWTVGARDRFLWRAGRRLVAGAAKRLRVAGERVTGYLDDHADGYVPVGEHDPTAAKMHVETLEKPRLWRFWVRLGAIDGRRDSRLGVTLIPTLVPFCLAVLWWVAFIAAMAWNDADRWLIPVGVFPLAIGLGFWRPWLRVRLLWVDDRPPIDRDTAIRSIENRRVRCRSKFKVRQADDPLKLHRYAAAVVVTTGRDFGVGDAKAKLELVRAIRKKNPYIAVFVLTPGAGAPEDAPRKAGATGVAGSEDDLATLLGDAKYRCTVSASQHCAQLVF